MLDFFLANLNRANTVHAGLWDHLPPLPPPALLHAGTTLPSLRPRYPTLPDASLAPIAKDLSIEDAQLQHYLAKGRLEIWWTGVMEAAKKAVRAEADEEGEKKRRRKSVEKVVKARLVGRDWKARGEVIERDESGDVIMG